MKSSKSQIPRQFGLYPSSRVDTISARPDYAIIVDILGSIPEANNRLVGIFMSEFYDFKPLSTNGEIYDLASLKGKVVLVVNVASKCGLVQQYAELESLYTKYKDRGLEILAFPCNQFGQQEPESEDRIVQFCKARYGVTFTIMKKVSVNGRDEEPLYTWLKDQKSGFLGFKGIKWNFEKFIVDREGNVVKRFGSATTPLSFESDIQLYI